MMNQVSCSLKGNGSLRSFQRSCRRCSLPKVSVFIAVTPLTPDVLPEAVAAEGAPGVSIAGPVSKVANNWRVRLETGERERKSCQPAGMNKRGDNYQLSLRRNGLQGPQVSRRAQGLSPSIRQEKVGNGGRRQSGGWQVQPPPPLSLVFTQPPPARNSTD